MKPTTKDRLSMPTPDYFKRLAKRILLSLGGLASVGVAMTSSANAYGLNEKITDAIMWTGGILIAVGVIGGGIGAWVANLVYDDKKQLNK